MTTTRAELRIYPGDLSPHEVTRRLQLTPSKTFFGGEAWTTSLGQERLHQRNGWFLSSEGRVASVDTRPHLEWLLAQLQPKARVLGELQELPEMKMSVCCAWNARPGQLGPTLRPEQMAALAKLALECSFEIVPG